MTIDKELVQDEAARLSMRGKEIEFADGKVWKIRTLPLKIDKDARIMELLEKVQGGGFDNETAIELCVEAIKLNYPDVKVEDVNPDLDDAFNVMTQLTGGNLGK